jgi:hypothetical protein
LLIYGLVCHGGNYFCIPHASGFFFQSLPDYQVLTAIIK